ncbi:hypothetical protein A5624_18145 [Mycobacterium sp. 1482292.6]|nr:hypothetical protein A5624_18145 [Mycobacterium sp. 1482292.6]
MRVDGRDIIVSGNLLQPLTRRTNDILRLILALLFLALVITGSVITRPQWIALERSVSQIVGVLSPTQSDVAYLIYGLAIVALPFMILIGLSVAGQWKLLGAYATAGLSAIVLLSISGTGLAAPRWHFDALDRLTTLPAQFLDDPRWIGMLAAVLTVSGPWLPARWRHWWWALLLAFVPIHLVVSAIVPARSLVGLAVVEDFQRFPQPGNGSRRRAFVNGGAERAPVRVQHPAAVQRRDRDRRRVGQARVADGDRHQRAVFDGAAHGGH